MVLSILSKQVQKREYLLIKGETYEYSFFKGYHRYLDNQLLKIREEKD